MSHDCNVNIKGIDNINSHMHDSSDVNVMNLLSINQRMNRIHDRRNYYRPISLSGTFNDLLSCIQIHFWLSLHLYHPPFSESCFGYIASRFCTPMDLLRDIDWIVLFVIWLLLDCLTSSNGIIITR